MSIFLIQECYKFVPNKFELVLIASKRAKDICVKSSKLFSDPLKDKSTIIALKEIKSGCTNNFLDET